MSFVRGSNPIWYEVDLTAHAFDDTFYLFILQNQIPYIPATVWQDPFGNVPWSNPIQFFANGTLPNNIYYDPAVVYRLEFRQGPTQADPLIYLVENYVPGSSGDTPIDETSFSTDNQVSNPQFALLNFISPLTLNSISTQSINFAPDWYLDLTGSGNVTLTQVLLNNAAVNPSNASYAVQIQLNGSWTGAILRQRYHQTGVLWANTFVSSNIMALTATAPQTISAILVDSQGNTLATVLAATPLTEAFNDYQGVGQLPASIDTDFPPTAYIEYQLILPNNCNITVSSIQLISGDVGIEFPYEQTTIERQVDQTFHYYKPQLQYKPIPSYLTGWDFALNPYQAQGTSAFGPVTSSGANTSYYIADQTVLFQTINSAFTTHPVSSGTALGLQITASLASSFAIIQYLSGPQVLELLRQRMAVQLKCSKTGANLVGTVGLYYTTNAAVPVLPLSLFTGITAGVPALTSGWVPVANANGPQTFTVTTTSASTPFSLNGFDATADANVLNGTAVNFAIAIVFNTMVINEILTLNYCSLVGGDIATRPAPQTFGAVLSDCQYYYQTSFLYGTTPAQNVGASTGESYGILSQTSSGTGYGPIIKFPVPQRAAATPTLYNPSAANGEIRNEIATNDWSSSTITPGTNTQSGFSTQGTINFGGSAQLGNLLGVHWTADARLGII